VGGPAKKKGDRGEGPISGGVTLITSEAIARWRGTEKKDQGRRSKEKGGGGGGELRDNRGAAEFLGKFYKIKLRRYPGLERWGKWMGIGSEEKRERRGRGLINLKK